MQRRGPTARILTIRLNLATIIAWVVGFAAGFAITLWAPWDTSPAVPQEEASSGLMLPVAAQKLWFPPMDAYQGESLADEDFDALLATLKERMEAEETRADFAREAPIYLHNFVRRVAMPELNAEQSETTYAYFDQLAQEHPDHEQIFKQRRDMLENYYAKANERSLPFNIAAHGWFPHAGDFATDGEPFSDDAVETLLEILDLMLTMPETVADFESECGIHFWRFGNRLQMGRLTAEQTERVVAYFDEVAARHPEAAEAIARNRFQVQNLLPGRTAPDITGTDLDGVEFSLSEYRGNIAVIYFSGQWCGPCRTEYPYQRFMLELYEEDPVVVLSVNSDEDMETIREAKEEEGLDYRVWWDGHGEVNTEGPIATEWNVTGWPSIYILDENGVIRFAQKRHADVITSVNELLWDLQWRRRQEATETES